MASLPDAISDVINKYLAALNIHRYIIYALDDEDKSLQVTSTAIQYLRRLMKIHPHNTNVIWCLLLAEFSYIYNMLRVGRLQNAQQYIDHWLDVWSTEPEGMPKSNIMRRHVVMMNLKATVLDSQGCAEQALLVTQKVHDIVKPPLSGHQPSFDDIIQSMVQEARLRMNLGHGEEALQVAEESLRLARDDKVEPFIDSLVWSLHAVACAALSSRRYTRAIETAREGCNISSSPNRQNSHDEYNICIGPSLFAILSSAEANLAGCSTALDYAHRAVEESQDICRRKWQISGTTAEQSYMETRGNLAEILPATGDLSQTWEISEERRAYFSKRVKNRVGNYRDLAPILRMLGVLCCSEGLHEEGDTAAKELSRIIMNLGSTFPSLQEQVKIRLRHQASLPILKVLDDMSHKLDCKHQAEVLSLFEV